MWAGGQGGSPTERYGGPPSASNGGSGAEEAADATHDRLEGGGGLAAALAARMAYAAAAPEGQLAQNAASLLYGTAGLSGAAAAAAAASPGEEDPALLYAQRQRELELYQLQQQIQERQAIEDAARSRILEHAAREQIQEYERTRLQLELMAEMQQRDREARIEALEAERERLVNGTAARAAGPGAEYAPLDMDAAAAAQERQIAEYLASARQQGGPPPGHGSLELNPAGKGEESADIGAGSTAAGQSMLESSAKNDAATPKKEGAMAKKPAPKKESPTKKASSKKKEALKKSPAKESSQKKKSPSKKSTSEKDNSSTKDEPTSTESAASKAEPASKLRGKELPPMNGVSGKEPETPLSAPSGKGSAKKSQSPKKKKATKKQEGNGKTPLDAPSSSQMDGDKTPTPTEAKSSSAAAAKKRKKSPAKASAASSGSKAKRAKKSPGGAAGARKAAGLSLASLVKRKPGVPSMDDTVPAITEVQFENAEALMTEFCRVPFLAEFSRPVSLLHPELMTLYSKIIHHPMDLGHVCRAIRRREYKSTRDIQLDVWRVFSNCIKFHMHPSNRENAIPSFISIAMHLRDFFNALWREYMMPSDAPPRAPGKGISHVHSTFQKRAEARKERLSQVSTTVLTPKCLNKVAAALDSFISSGGKVDRLDRDAILGDASNATGDLATFIQSLRDVVRNLASKAQDGQEYTVMDLHRDLKRCYTEDVFEHEILKKMKISQRLDRILGKALAPIHEVSCRGVNQSSIWGCMAAAIWARESKKKPYWPGVVLGILAPDDQKEDWHQALTDRNEARLPEKLRDDLKVAKKRAEQGLKRQSSDLMSYFLVEFMGSHEFIWVKESDIIENFDPEEDVNIASAAGNITKKRRSTAFNTKQMSNAIEEGRWALEEFELQLNNTCGDRSDDEDDFNDDAGYTYDILCRSDDEADEMDGYDGKAHESDIEELNELLASDGLLDFSVEGRKKAKARATALKKQNALLVKKEKEREKAKKAKVVAPKDDAKKLEKQLEMQEKREQRELDSRRKKRVRDHEKALKELERKAKKKKSGGAEKKTNPNEVQNKRGRAEAIAKGFLMRKCAQDASYNGASFQPTSSVEPSGLLGMALAFRAASGEIPFLDTNGKSFVENGWENIDVNGPPESSERCKRLQEQIELIEKEISKADSSSERRNALAKVAEEARSAARNKVLDADEQVRATYAKKKKKATPKKESADMKTKTEAVCDKDDIPPSEADLVSDKLAIQNDVQRNDASSDQAVQSKILDL